MNTPENMTARALGDGVKTILDNCRDLGKGIISVSSKLDGQVVVQLSAEYFDKCFGEDDETTLEPYKGKGVFQEAVADGVVYVCYRAAFFEIKEITP